MYFVPVDTWCISYTAMIIIPLTCCMEADSNNASLDIHSGVSGVGCENKQQ